MIQVELAALDSAESYKEDNEILWTVVTNTDNDEEEQVWEEENQKQEEDLTTNWNQWHKCIRGPT